LQKPPPKTSGEPEIIEYQGFTWKCCDKCFNGTWNCTHITSEHVAGIGKCNRRRQTPSGDTTNNNTPATTSQANLAQVPVPLPNDDSPLPPAEANIAASSSTLDFM
jgi:hypothetical protein